VCPIIRERIMGRGFAPPRRSRRHHYLVWGGVSAPSRFAGLAPLTRFSRVTSAALLKTLPRIDSYFWDAALARRALARDMARNGFCHLCHPR